MEWGKLDTTRNISCSIRFGNLDGFSNSVGMEKRSRDEIREWTEELRGGGCKKSEREKRERMEEIRE